MSLVTGARPATRLCLQWFLATLIPPWLEIKSSSKGAQEQASGRSQWPCGSKATLASPNTILRLRFPGLPFARMLELKQIFMKIPRKWTSGQGFRPQPMGLCLNGHPANPVHCLFQGSGPDRTSTALRLRPPASPFAPAFTVKDGTTDDEYSRAGGIQTASSRWISALSHVRRRRHCACNRREIPLTFARLRKSNFRLTKTQVRDAAPELSLSRHRLNVPIPFQRKCGQAKFDGGSYFVLCPRVFGEYTYGVDLATSMTFVLSRMEAVSFRCSRRED